MLKRLFDKCVNLASSKFAAYSLAVVSFIESSFFPVPPDIMIVPMVVAKKEKYFKIFLIATLFSAFGALFGYFVAKFMASSVPQRKSISLECGLQNGTLAVYVASKLFDEMVFMVPTAAYALIMFATSIFFVLIVRKIN